MAEHHALGPAGGSRGVNNGRQRGRIARHVARLAATLRQPLIDRFEPRVVAGARQRFHRQDAHQPAELIAHAGEGFPLLVRAEQQHLATGIVEDIGDVFGTVLRIQRHHDQAEAERRLIKDHPLRRVAQHHRHAIAGLQTVAFQRRLPARDLVIHLRPGVIAPVGVPRVEIAAGDCLRRAFDALAEQAVERYRLLG